MVTKKKAEMDVNENLKKRREATGARKIDSKERNVFMDKLKFTKKKLSGGV